MIEYLLKKRKITILFFIMVVSVGFLSVAQLPRQEMPDITITFAIVTTTYPGASPERMEQAVTRKLEQKIKELPGIKTITSTSGFGYSSIVVESKDGVKPDDLWDELRKKVKDAEADLPDGANKPEINDDLNRTAFYTVNVTAESRDQLYSLRDNLKNWKDQLRTLPNVADVTIGGLPDQEIRVDVDPLKLQHYGISWTQVLAAVKAENERVPIGDLDVGSRTYQLILPDYYSPENLNKVIISRSKDGFPVYLQDIGKAYLSQGETDVFVYHNGKPAAVLGVVVEKGTDVPSLHTSVVNMMQTLEKSLPAWAAVEPVFSQSQRVKDSYDDLIREMIIATAAVLFICTLGLNLITAIIIAFAIPISMAVGLLFLPPLGITINSISIYALIIVLGILVDDAVVVNDNIERRLSVLKESPFTASVNGAKEVSVSIVTATLATLFSFGPLMFLRGNSGEFMRPLPVIIILTMTTSMIMSLTIIPIFRHWYERRRKNNGHDEKPAGLLGRQLVALTRWYADRLMPRILNRPLRTGLIGVGIGTLAYGLVAFTPVELFPAADLEELPINIRLPQGTSIEETNRVTGEISSWLASQPGVKMVAACAGASADMWYGGGTALSGARSNRGQVMVKIDREKLDLKEVSDRWQEEFKVMYPGAVITPMVINTGPPVGDPISLHIYGDDIEKLRAISQEVKERISKVPGAYDIQDDFGLDRHTLEFQVNKPMMDQKLVSYNDLSTTLRLVSEGIKISQFDDGKNLIDINLYLDKSQGDPTQVFNSITVPNARGEQIPISQIADLKPSFNIQFIPHRNLSRSVNITGQVKDRTVTEVTSDIMQSLESLDLPEGYRWDVGGEFTEQTDIFVDMGRLSIIVFFLILILIAMQFYSLTIPLLIMSTVYLAVAGSLIGLFITRTPLGFVSMMGAIALAGIVVRNGIVLIDFVEKERQTGIELKEAVIKAGEARLRPILLTSATATGGLLPLALFGDPLLAPIAKTIISGLLFSTALTLVVVPSLYVVLAGLRDRKRGSRDKKGPGAPGELKIQS
ncbi:MAG: multidrug ABC transporter [Peptococcaceae bacterium BICA1-7]|nr:MAG: multidrug ABC transporter [Peptococcaceae bacterium BICA1-7]HBV98739.1 AcrB/AcrD/AcrF family protein [Desulfotomaculum sp.]